MPHIPGHNLPGQNIARTGLELALQQIRPQAQRAEQQIATRARRGQISGAQEAELFTRAQQAQQSALISAATRQDLIRQQQEEQRRNFLENRRFQLEQRSREMSAQRAREDEARRAGLFGTIGSAIGGGVFAPIVSQLISAPARREQSQSRNQALGIQALGIAAQTPGGIEPSSELERILNEILRRGGFGVLNPDDPIVALPPNVGNTGG